MQKESGLPPATNEMIYERDFLMNDQELQCFLAAAKHLSFSDAAAHMFLSPSAFSRNIAKLEKELQLTLFERDTKNVSLTAAGFFLNQQLSQLYTDFLLCVQKAQMLQMGLSGQLRLGIPAGHTMDPHFQQILRTFEKPAWISILSCSGLPAMS